MRKISKLFKFILSITITISLFGIIPTVYADDENTVYITKYDEYQTTYEVKLGTDRNDISFVSEIIGYDELEESYNILASVTCEDYDGNTAGTYYCSVNLLDGYTLINLELADIEVIVQEEETINISIDIIDDIKRNGSLVPNLSSESEVDLSGAVYTWERSVDGVEYTEVNCEYVDENGSVNIVADDGALVYYRVNVLLDNVSATSASYQVPYSNQIRNGSFENVVITSWYQQLSNNTSGLYWRTTGVGTRDKAGRDIELVRPSKGLSSTKSAFGTTKVPDGEQFAELNCEAVGTLYQDILTEPGMTLYWSLYHSGRTGADKMAVVILDSDDPRIESTDFSVPSQVEALAITGKDDSFTSMTHGTNSWTYVTGSYVVPEGQYVTRFFFASLKGTSPTVGNLIDRVQFGKEASYTFEYYVDNTLVDSEIQTINVHGKTGITVSAKLSASDLCEKYNTKELALSSSTLDGNNYNKKTSINTAITSHGSVIRLYYVSLEDSNGIYVNNTLEGLDLENISLEDLVFTFTLEKLVDDVWEEVIIDDEVVSLTVDGDQLGETVALASSEVISKLDTGRYRIVEKRFSNDLEGYIHSDTVIGSSDEAISSKVLEFDYVEGEDINIVEYFHNVYEEDTTDNDSDDNNDSDNNNSTDKIGDNNIIVIDEVAYFRPKSVEEKSNEKVNKIVIEEVIYDDIDLSNNTLIDTSVEAGITSDIHDHGDCGIHFVAIFEVLGFLMYAAIRAYKIDYKNRRMIKRLDKLKTTHAI